LPSSRTRTLPPQTGQASRRACSLALFGLVAALPASSALRSASPDDEAPPGEAQAAAHAAPSVATGRIEGAVVISTVLSTRRPRFRIYADPGPGALPPAQEASEIRNVVLYVQGAAAPEGTVPARMSIEQQGERFVPHVLPLLRGGTVDFPNRDDLFHNVFSLSSAKSFDLGRYPRGSAKSVVFDRSGVVQVFCHLHSDMSAVVLVLDNPYFAVPTSAGHYGIDGVPPGDYTVVGWHERSRPVARTVHVAAGATTRLDFDIPLPAGGESAAR
jgi:plastocyanin